MRIFSWKKRRKRVKTGRKVIRMKEDVIKKHLKSLRKHSSVENIVLGLIFTETSDPVMKGEEWVVWGTHDPTNAIASSLEIFHDKQEAKKYFKKIAEKHRMEVKKAGRYAFKEFEVR